MTSQSRRVTSLVAATAVAAAGLVGSAVGASAGQPPTLRFTRAAATAWNGSASMTHTAPAIRAVAERSVARPVLRRTVKTTSEQVLQRFAGLAGTPQAPVPTLATAAGSQQVLVIGPGGVRVVAKSNGKPILATTNLKQFFGVSAPGVTVTQPTAAFDPVGKRFVIAAVTNNAGTVGVVVRVSKGATLAATGSWRRAFGYAVAGTVVESAPKIGISSDKVVLTTLASDSGDPSVANAIIVIPKQALYQAVTSGPAGWVADVDSTYDGQTPAVNASSGKAAFVVVPAATTFTVYTLSGPATVSPPQFSKSVMYPTNALVNAPDVVQSGGDTIALPTAINSASVAWRHGVVWTALSVGCTPLGDVTQRACLRLVKVTTSNGMSLGKVVTKGAKGGNWFGAGLAIDSSGEVHLGFSRNNATVGGPISSAVVALSAKGAWSPATTVAKGNAFYSDGTGSTTVAWANAGSASVDPTSPWDVWSSVVRTSSAVTAPNWTSNLVRMSRARNQGSLSAQPTRTTAGSRVTFRTLVHRPNSAAAIAGLPVALQFRANGASGWHTVATGTTSGFGTKSWTLRVTRSGTYRSFGKAVSQRGGAGLLVGQSTGGQVVIRVS